MDTQPQPVVQPTFRERAKAWFAIRQTFTRGVLTIGVLVIGCGCCGFGYVVGISPSSSKPAAAAQSTVTQTSQATDTPADTATPALPTATAKPKAWVTVQHFTGNQNGKTPTFTVKDGDKIVWSVAVGGEFGGYFSITTYNSDGSYGDLLATTTTPPAQSGNTIVHGDADIYLDISDSAGAYDIAVQRFQ